MSDRAVCNMCGKEFNIWDEAEDFTVNHLLGYGTKYDLRLMHLKLCCRCIEKVIDQCKFSPIVGETWVIMQPND